MIVTKPMYSFQVKHALCIYENTLSGGDLLNSLAQSIGYTHWDSTCLILSLFAYKVHSLYSIRKNK